MFANPLGQCGGIHCAGLARHLTAIPENNERGNAADIEPGSGIGIGIGIEFRQTNIWRGDLNMVYGYVSRIDE